MNTPNEPEEPDLLGPSPYPSLTVKYLFLFLYGVTASLVGVATLDVVVGSAWGLIWPALVSVFSLLALLGVIRSRTTKKYLFEVVATLMLIGLLYSYSLAIIYRSFASDEWFRLHAAWLPVILSVYPLSRVFSITRRRVRR